MHREPQVARRFERADERRTRLLGSPLQLLHGDGMGQKQLHLVAFGLGGGSGRYEHETSNLGGSGAIAGARAKLSDRLPYRSERRW